MKTALHTLLVIPLLFGYLFLSLFSLSHMGSMAGMDMDMADCPYLPFQHSAGKNLGDHLAAWSSFTLIITGEIFLLALLSFTLIFPRLDTSLTRKFNLFLALYSQRLFRPPIVSLFSQGILHPRIP